MTRQPPQRRNHAENGLKAKELTALLLALEQQFEGTGAEEKFPKFVLDVLDGFLVREEAGGKSALTTATTVPGSRAASTLLFLRSQPWYQEKQVFWQLCVATLWAEGRNAGTSEDDLSSSAEAADYTGRRFKQILEKVEPFRGEIAAGGADLERWHLGRIEPLPAPWEKHLPFEPKLFFGRQADATTLRARLCMASQGAGALRTQVITAVDGMPGVGKSTFAAKLVHDPEIRRNFPGGIFWIDVGPIESGWPALAMHELAVQLGHDDLMRILLPRAQIRKLSELLGSEQRLIVADDVWHGAHAVRLQECMGPHCALLIGTRKADVAHDVAAHKDGVHTLQCLDPEDAEQMLQALAPAACERAPAACTALLQAVGYLPLAIRIAGPLLQREVVRRDWSAEGLVEEIRRTDLLVGQPAPADTTWLHTTPFTLGGLVLLSVNALSEAARRFFALLADFPPKPFAIDLAKLGAQWGKDQARALARELLDANLLEQNGGDQQVFHVHPMVSVVARVYASGHP